MYVVVYKIEKNFITTILYIAFRINITAKIATLNTAQFQNFKLMLAMGLNEENILVKYDANYDFDK